MNRKEAAMKRYMGAVVLMMGAGVLLLAMLQFAPRASAAPQQAGRGQAQAMPSMNTGVPWAYGFPTPIPPPAPARGGGGAGAGAGGGAGRGGAAPAAPAAPPEDRDAIHHVPGSTQAFAIKQIDDNAGPADWFPEDHPKMPEIVAHGQKATDQKAAVNACGFCHYPNGKGRPNNAGPAGLPANYILQQLEDFRSGARTSWDKRKRNTQQMIDIAKGVTPENAEAAAQYLSSMKWTPYVKVVEADMVPKTYFAGGGGGLTMPVEGAEAGMEPLGMRIVETPMDVEQTEPLRNPRSGFIAYVPVGSLKKGEDLVVRGGNGKTLACAACHGEGLKGTDKFPSLAGRSPSYLARQISDFQRFTRVGPGSQLMEPVVHKLTDDDILYIVAYIASLQP
jgi:cytochrome c553